MEITTSLAWWPDLALRIIATLIGLLGAFVLRRGWQKCSKEYDRSMLIWLGTNNEACDYTNAPVIVGQFPFNELAGAVQSNLDIRNVIGFVIGKPIWIQDISKLRLRLDPIICKPGYYAYCVIQWEQADTVLRFFQQGIHIRRTRYDGRPQMLRDMRETIFIGFGTDATPDVKTGTRPSIVHIQTGLLASLKYQPYLKGGFKSSDIKWRQLAPQTKAMIRCKDIITKEWRNA